MNPPAFPTRKLVLFALLSAADFGLTWHLLGRGAAYEGNPLAAWWLARGGWLGLAAFKAAAVLTAGGLGVVICRRRPAAGHRVLAFGCAALAAVALYSGYLSAAERSQAAEGGAAPAAVLDEADRLEAARRRSEGYGRVRGAVADDLRARRCTLEDAADRLADTEQAHDPDWLRRLHMVYPGCDDREGLAVCALNAVVGEGTSAPDGQLSRELRDEFRTLFARDVPRPFEGEVRTASAGAPAGTPVFAADARVQ